MVLIFILTQYQSLYSKTFITVQNTDLLKHFVYFFIIFNLILEALRNPRTSLKKKVSHTSLLNDMEKYLEAISLSIC